MISAEATWANHSCLVSCQLPEGEGGGGEGGGGEGEERRGRRRGRRERRRGLGQIIVTLIITEL